ASTFIDIEISFINKNSVGNNPWYNSDRNARLRQHFDN
ncbi:unnamed protein product, partial [Rotaria socialis]